MTREPILGTAIVRNGLLLVAPAIVITFGLWSRLPAAYGAESFDHGVPTWLIFAENVLRIAVFAIPVFLYFGGRDVLQVRGWYLYGLGLLLYLGSYLAQIYLPGSAWSTSLLGFTAPAWTTLFWFVGIGLVCANTWLPFSWHRAVYLSVAVAFVVLHVAHASLAFFG